LRCNGLSHSICVMISFARLYLISVLVLLQFAAPLIHAHTNSVAHLGASVHLPEFEQVNALQHAPEFLAPTSQNDNMVVMSAGMKNETEKWQLNANLNFIALLVNVFFIAKPQLLIRCFALQTEPILHTYFFNLSAPRAPPFFYAR